MLADGAGEITTSGLDPENGPYEAHDAPEEAEGHTTLHPLT